MSRAQREAVDALMRQAPLDLGGVVEEQRAIFEEMLVSHGLPEGVTVRPEKLGEIPAIAIDVPGVEDGSVLLYFHCGAYVLGSASSGLGLAAEIATRARSRALSVEYRLAPEHPFPAALEDAVAAYEAVLGSGTPSSRVALVGESAGAGLAVAVMVALKDSGLPQPAAALLLSPWVDLTLEGESVRTRAAADPVLTEAGLRRRVLDYVGCRDPIEPLISPLFAGLEGLPPLSIQVGSNEILLDDATRLAVRAAAADVAVALEVTPGVPHVFPAFASILEEGAAALVNGARFLRTHLSVRPSPGAA